MIPNPNRDYKVLHAYKPSSYDWCSNYQLGSYGGVVGEELCQVCLGMCYEEDVWRVSVGGNDDHFVKKDFDTYEEALVCFTEVIKLPDVTFEICVNYMQFTGEY